MVIDMTDDIPGDGFDKGEGAVIEGPALVGGAALAEILPGFGSAGGDVVDLAFLLDSALMTSPAAANAPEGTRLDAAGDISNADGGGMVGIADVAPLPHFTADAGLRILYDDDLASRPA